jgi:hypothetical protein
MMVTGKFEGAGEFAHVTKRVDTAGAEQWVLNLASRQTGLRANAGCFNVSAVSDEFAWSQGQATVHPPFVLDHACFLTRMRGDFDGGGEQIFIRWSGGQWNLGGKSQQEGVAASARCVPAFALRPNLKNGELPFSWAQGRPPTAMGSLGNDEVCFLTMITGHFEGFGERVAVQHPFIGSQDWELTGHSLQEDVAANALCMTP